MSQYSCHEAGNAHLVPNSACFRPAAVHRVRIVPHAEQAAKGNAEQLISVQRQQQVRVRRPAIRPLDKEHLCTIRVQGVQQETDSQRLRQSVQHQCVPPSAVRILRQPVQMRYIRSSRVLQYPRAQPSAAASTKLSAEGNILQLVHGRIRHLFLFNKRRAPLQFDDACHTTRARAPQAGKQKLENNTSHTA